MQQSCELPEIFEQFSEARKQGFISVKKLKEEGKKVVGVYCAFTPTELIMAAGAVPIGLCGTSEEPIPDAERDLPRNLCPLIKSSYGFAITDKCPYFYFSDLLVGETTCDGKKKMYELLGEIKPMHVMQLPQRSKGDTAYNLWKEELLILKKRLEHDFNVEITEEKLRAAINLKNRQRKALKEFYALSKNTPPPMNGYDMHKVLFNADFKFDKEEQIKEIENLTKGIREEYEKNGSKVSKDSPRILITGCPIGGATDKIIKTIEDCGGVVVCYENCGGAKSNDRLVDEDIDPIDALTDKYLNIACSVMSPNDDRLKLLSKLIDEYQIDGIVEVILQACHTYNVESLKIKNFVNGNKGIPYIALETDYSQSDIGQLKTRIGAFIEMI